MAQTWFILENLLSALVACFSAADFSASQLFAVLCRGQIQEGTAALRPPLAEDFYSESLLDKVREATLVHEQGGELSPEDRRFSGPAMHAFTSLNGWSLVVHIAAAAAAAAAVPVGGKVALSLFRMLVQKEIGYKSEEPGYAGLIDEAQNYMVTQVRRGEV